MKTEMHCIQIDMSEKLQGVARFLGNTCEVLSVAFALKCAIKYFKLVYWRPSVIFRRCMQAQGIKPVFIEWRRSTLSWQHSRSLR